MGERIGDGRGRRALRPLPDAVTASRRLFGDEGALQRMRLLERAEAFQRGDLGARKSLRRTESSGVSGAAGTERRAPLACRVTAIATPPVTCQDRRISPLFAF
jgi:hypothetical protein